jgi:hypothetical protein
MTAQDKFLGFGGAGNERVQPQRHAYRLAARIIAESCESCEQREFDYYLHDTFVCETCAWEG